MGATIASPHHSELPPPHPTLSALNNWDLPWPHKTLPANEHTSRDASWHVYPAPQLFCFLPHNICPACDATHEDVNEHLLPQQSISLSLLSCLPWQTSSPCQGQISIHLALVFYSLTFWFQHLINHYLTAL